VHLTEIAIYMDYKFDESYTPNKFSIRAGTSALDLKEIKTVEVVEPVGWLHVPLKAPNNRYTTSCVSSAGCCMLAPGSLNKVTVKANPPFHLAAADGFGDL
jgi:Anaphase-promoting complex, subunit 10 (APC10)